MGKKSCFQISYCGGTKVVPFEKLESFGWLVLWSPILLFFPPLATFLDEGHALAFWGISREGSVGFLFSLIFIFSAFASTTTKVDHIQRGLLLCAHQHWAHLSSWLQKKPKLFHYVIFPWKQQYHKQMGKRWWLNHLLHSISFSSCIGNFPRKMWWSCENGGIWGLRSIHFETNYGRCWDLYVGLSKLFKGSSQ